MQSTDKIIIKNNISGERYPNSFLEFKMDKSKSHPTQKPILLMEYLIKTYSNEGDTVLDNCMGSGSTGVACNNTNRKFIGIEIEKTFYRTACRRVSGEFVKDKNPEKKFINLFEKKTRL